MSRTHALLIASAFGAVSGSAAIYVFPATRSWTPLAAVVGAVVGVLYYWVALPPPPTTPRPPDDDLGLHL